jgi:hypothetical protein
MIDRQSVVRRHNVQLTSPDPAAVLTVGNGDFAYTADITGMQTFTALLADSPKNQYLRTGHSPQIGSLLPVYLPANGALLAAVSLMVAGWDEAGTDLPGCPRDGTWTIHHEGFTPWP